MNKDILNTVSQLLKISVEVAEKNYMEIPEINAYYFSNPIRGGGSVIITDSDEKLGSTYRVS